MPLSQAYLRIQEFADAKGLTLEELAQASNVSEEILKKYSTSSIEITEDSASNLRKIATKLDIAVAKLIKPVAKIGGFRLRIFEITKQRNLTLNQLSEISGVHPTLLAFYSTQAISKQKILEDETQENLSRISRALGVDIEELKVASELSETMLRVDDYVKEKGLTLEDLSILNNVPIEFMRLISTQPIDLDRLRVPSRVESSLCDYFPCSIFCPCPS